MKKTIQLSGNWKLFGFSPGKYNIADICERNFACIGWYDVKVPGDVHTTLIRNNVIDNPAYGYNDTRCGWVEKKVWIYRTNFYVTEQDLRSDRIEIVFEGLDTYATVYINGNKLADFQNMLVEHKKDVTGMLEQGENILVVEFHVMSEMAKRELPSGFWINYSTERAYARKPGYSYGWDWSPRIATVGIWKPVFLVEYNCARLDSVQIKTSAIDADKRTAVINIHARSENISGGCLSYRISITDEDGNCQKVESCSDIFSISIEDVRLWWTADTGYSHLYIIVVELLSDGQVTDRYECSYGVRTIEVKQKADDGTNRFVFVLNGIEICARGANWVPVSNFPGASEDETYIRLLNLARDAGMNMLCIWGGGIYEKDVFYEACDRMGILVWQYFMFACGEYPDYDPEFVTLVRDEVNKVVIRLRNHPSIALWVGNVESQMLSEKIGLDRDMYGKCLFEKDIPEWLHELDDTRFYIPTSPFGGETANSMEAGDRHNWDVWFTDIPYTDYSKDNATFVSEYGIHAAPVRATIEKYLNCSNLDINSHQFKYLNKDQSLDRMYYLMETHALRPSDLDEYIDYSMLVQAEGLKFGTEHYRRNFPRTGGALIWQLNDCCPVHSWSMIDVDLIPKASYYYSKRFFAPFLVSLEEVDEITTGVWAVNNTMGDYNGMVRVSVMDFFGNEYHCEQIKVSANANTSIKVKDIVVGGRFYPNVIIPDRHRNFYVRALCDANDIPAIRYFGKFSDVSFPHTDLKVKCSGSIITISAATFARFVRIDGELKDLKLSDNYFDIEPGSSREVSVNVISGKPLCERRLYVKALNSDACRIY